MDEDKQIKQRRNRSINFTPQEKDVLISLVEKYAYIIESKTTNAVSWSQKNEMWDKISIEFNRQCQSFRTTKNLKDKYENLKKEAKVSLAAQRKETYMTGGGSCSTHVSSASQRLAAIMGKAGSGLSNDVDSDKVEAPEDILNGEIDDILNVETTEDIVNDPLTIYVDDATEEGDQSECQYEQPNMEDECIKKEPVKRNSWSSWNPQQLKQKRSEKLQVKRRCNADNGEALLNKQIQFFENEDSRAEERHQHQKEEMNLKIELLKEEIKFKKLQIEKIDIN